MELDRKMVLCVVDLISMLLPQLRSQLLPHLFTFDLVDMTVLIVFVWSYRDKARGSVDACADLKLCHLDGDCSRPQYIKLKRNSPQLRWIVTTRCSVGPDARWIVKTKGFEGPDLRWIVKTRLFEDSGAR